jgi:hypothetical protein
MLPTYQRTRFKAPLRYGFAEVPYADMRTLTGCLDIAQWLEQQTPNLCVAGSNPVVEQGPVKAHFNSRSPVNRLR